MNNLSEPQQEALFTLSRLQQHGFHQGMDVFDGRTIHSLEKRNFVQFYRHPSFLRGAVKLTEEGQRYVEKLFEEKEIAV